MRKSLFRKDIEDDGKLKLEAYYNKEVEYYSSLNAHWFNSKNEKDKLILTLSIAGIGLLATFYQDKISNYLSFSFFILSLVFFLICIFCGLSIFERNSIYLQSLIKENPNKEIEKKLKKLDKFFIYSFFLGLIFTILLSIIYIFSNKEKKNSELKNLIEEILELKDDLKEEKRDLDLIIKRNEII